ncbi:MAG: hypothetical protein QXT38_00035 [Candidatus Aenigmatarchaeota archaeon]
MVEEISIYSDVIKKRIEDEIKGVESDINISQEMKDALEKNFDETFSKEKPFYYHYLCIGKKPKVIPIKKLTVIEKNKILIELERPIKFRGRASLMCCLYSRIEKKEHFLISKAIGVKEMKGWQFKGNLYQYEKGYKKYILEVDEIYCAISGKKLQESKKRSRIKLINGIIKFFYRLSGEVSMRIAKNVLKKYGIKMKDEKIIGELEDLEFDNLISDLIQEYSKIYGKRFASYIPELLGYLSETFRVSPKKEWRPIGK